MRCASLEDPSLLLADAPANGTFYGRLDGAWSNLPQGAGSGLDADLLDGQEAAAFAQLAAANTFSANQKLRSVDETAAVGPVLYLERLRTTSAANDALGELRFHGRNSAGAVVGYGGLRSILIDPTSGAETAALSLISMQGGASSARAYIAGGLYMPGTTDQGAGTINAQGLYVGGEELAFEKGTWTPNVSGGTYSGTVTGSSGTYTRIGDIAIVQGTIDGTDLSFADDTRYMTISNLPFDALEPTVGSWSAQSINGLHGAARISSALAVYLMGANRTVTDSALLFSCVYRIG